MEVTIHQTGEFMRLPSPTGIDLHRWVGISAGGIPMELWVARRGCLNREDQRRYEFEDRQQLKYKHVLPPADKAETNDDDSEAKNQETENHERGIRFVDHRQAEGCFFTF